VPTLRCYWDGAAWTQVQRWNGTDWVEE